MKHSWSIERVGIAEAGAVADILQEVTDWSCRFGDPIWAPEELALEIQQGVAAAGEQIAGFEGPAIVACMRLQRIDKLYWPDAPEGEALYLHKLAVRRASSGRGWSERMIRWAEQQCRTAGMPFLRLDTLAGTRLVSLYEQFGFRVVDREPLLIAGHQIVRMERLL
ncbi:MAG TPA: GNAT family N-acetyltransferase [Rhizomicrobium sp.]